GVRFGYKWFDSEGKQPLFPFGYGLSYTRFKYADLQVDPATKTATFTVENIGARSGTEIAQVYVALPKASGEHFRRLAGWQRVAVPAGQQKVVSVALEPLALATFNVQKDAWAWASGRYTVFVGGSSRDLPLVADAVLEPPAAPSEARVAVDLNHGWRFRQGDGVGGVPSGSFDDSQWSQVDLPHTWNRLGNAGTERSALTNTVQGVAWYRLRFRTPPPSSARRYFLQFDGVGAIADVWLNGHYLGKHAGAFSRFRFDASTAMNPAGDNLLVVKADNSRPQPGSTTENVIPLSADFFVFGGIYRGVALIATDPVHLDMLDFGGPGLYARAVTIDANAAAVRVSARLVNDGSKPRRVLVETRIEGDAQVVASTSTQLSASPGQPVSIDDTLQVARPRLWQGMKDPYLYRVVMTVRAEDGQVLDQVVQPLGLRSLRFDADQGFFLNGEHLFLKGVSMHQDRPVKGWAISRADQAEDFDLLRDMGANAVRLAHYQHDQYSYELADALGVVVWAEIPLVNKVSFDGSAASTALAANARQQLTELIRQNYNHPSIAVWSIGNETDLTATMTGGPSILADLLKSLNALAKSEDPGRFTSYADCCEASVAAQKSSEARGVAPRDAIVGITDTVGYNRYFGWYIGRLDDFGPMLDAAHARHPALPIAVSEYGAGGALTQHTDDPAGGPINPHGRPHPEEFQSWYHEASWKALRDRGYLWAVYIWNLFDFASDSRQEGDLTDVNEKGLISYDRRTRKDAFYFYRANWSSQPTLHLVGRRYLDRAYGVVDVKAYSNAPQATLWLNDRGQGMAPCTGGICLWHSVQLASGTNDLRATADVAGTVLRDSMRWTFAGSLASVRIKAGDISGYLTKAGQRYGSDAYFSGGVPGSINPPDTRAAARIAVAADDPGIYDSFREGAFAYRVPVPSGRYRVTLKFEEPSAGTAGAREFNVLANGKVVLKRFDIFAAAGGALKGVDRVFDSTSRDNTLLIEFVPVKGAALVSALAIEPLDRH
ncbi:MAG: glycoside hydrolase family 2 TIM barrel-domain containing protein, partial [Steroidobacteraceae bacterium]